MSLILHLSDLHLAALDADDVFGDHKISVVRKRDRNRRTQLISSSLRALGSNLRRAGRTLDAVVVSGDITDRGNPEGFALLDPTLEELGASLPPREQIMIVPGNHDVAWFTEPSSLDRYQAFLDGVRAHGYATPLLEGIDIDHTGRLLPNAVNPVIVLAEGDVVILGLNTANYCGVDEEPPEEVATAVAELDRRLGDDPTYQRLRKSWRRRGAFDLARLGKEQRRYGAQTLATAAAPTAVRVAAMHHQLLPVGLDEEVKPFESLLNLAQTRAFLADNEIDVLLHGHKHTAALYQDHPGQGRPSPLHTMVVCSTRTVGKGQTSDGEIAKLVEIDVELPTVHHVGFSSVPSCDEGATMSSSILTPTERFVLGGADIHRGLFSAATAGQVHEQLIHAFSDAADAADDVVRPVVCRVEQGASATELPMTFPSIPGRDGLEARQRWFTEMAEQWQRTEPGPGLEFNHGQRLRRYWRDVDQVARVIKMLGERSNSSRGVAVLIDPTTDPIEDNKARFPAFMLAQFLIRDTALHVVAYFRKQEMRYWWAINAAELAMLQKQVVDGLLQHGITVGHGTLTTITAIPTSAHSLPKVGIPTIDRIAADDMATVIRHSVSVVVGSELASEASRRWWQALFDDWYPASTPVPDGDPAPIFGLRTVAETLAAVAEAYDVASRVADVVESLRRLADGNERYLEQLHNSALNGHRTQWAQRTRREIEKLRGLLDSLLSG